MSERWAGLALASRNVFGTPEFVRSWAEHADAELELIEDERFVVPLVRERRGPLRLVRFAGHGASDEQGPVCAAADRPAAAAALRERLAAGGWDVFAGELMPRDGAWDALGARVASTPSSPVVHLASRDWDGFLSARSGNFRQELRRTLRKVEQAGGTFRLADASSLADDLDALFALHRERWPNGSDFGARERFHRAFAALALDRGWLRLWLLEVDGAIAAAWHGFRYANVQSYYQAGRSRRFDALKPGLALLAHTVRDAAADGCDEYRFLQGDEPFKFRFTDDDPGLVTLVASRGALGRAALLTALATRRARSRPPARPAA